jgi:hypothetical protein
MLNAIYISFRSRVPILQTLGLGDHIDIYLFESVTLFLKKNHLQNLYFCENIGYQLMNASRK